MAKNMGAKVVTTVSNGEKAEIAELAGADLIINYKEENIIDKIREFTNNHGIDHIVEVELGSNLSVTKEIIATYGTISSYGSANMPTPIIPFYPLMFKNVAMRFIFVYELPEKVVAEAIKAITNIAKIYKLDEIAEVHKLVESGKAI
jgi:NADPH2:quinone reductase